MTTPFHYPPELLEQLVETIPRLIRSKRGLLDFFSSAGVRADLIADLRQTVQTDRKSTSKFKLTRTVLVRLNEGGDATLRTRRELLKRVVEWEDFSTCWPRERLEAKGLVAEIRRVVDVKDTFTRINQERRREAEKSKRQYEAAAKTKHARVVALNEIRDRLGECFGMDDRPHQRGKALESILNDYFHLEGIGVREAFHVVGSQGEGITEQIDGAVEIDGHLYLVEMKWWSKPLGGAEVSPFLVKVFTRGNCGGIFIAQPGVTDPAITYFRDANVKSGTVFILNLERLYAQLDKQTPLLPLLRERVQRATLDKNPC